MPGRDDQLKIMGFLATEALGRTPVISGREKEPVIQRCVPTLSATKFQEPCSSHICSACLYPGLGLPDVLFGFKYPLLKSVSWPSRLNMCPWLGAQITLYCSGLVNCLSPLHEGWRATHGQEPCLLWSQHNTGIHMCSINV